MAENNVRPIAFDSDRDELLSILGKSKAETLAILEPAVSDGDALVYVVENEGQPAGWAAVRLAYRPDTGWSPDGGTTRYTTDPNAYLEYLEVSEALRGQGLGSRLIADVENVTASVGRKPLWLHTGQENVRAHRFYERNGWSHHDTIAPSWSPEKMRVYTKSLT